MEDKTKWLKFREYYHITNRINTSSNHVALAKLAGNKDYVAHHAFFPLLHKIIPQRRYKIIDFDESTLKPIRSHVDKKGKSTKKNRPIHYATHLDTIIYAYYAQEILQKPYEDYLLNNPGLSSCITAYRTGILNKGKNNVHYAKEVFDFIKSKGNCAALAFDIEGFFNNLDHKRLKRVWEDFLGFEKMPKDHYNIFKSVTNFSYILLDDLKIQIRKNQKGFDETKLAKQRQQNIFAYFESPTEFRTQIKEGKLRVFKNHWVSKDSEKRRIGTVQGLPMSSILANLYMLEFDEAMHKEIELNRGGMYRRYSDDIVVVCDQVEKDEIQRLVYDSIKKYHLTIAESKTEECNFLYNDQGKLTCQKIIKGITKEGQSLRYLGFEFYGDKTLIKSANLSKFYRRMKQAIKSKAKRLEKVKNELLTDNVPLYKRRLERIYTDKGIEGRYIETKKVTYRYDEITRQYRPIVKTVSKKYRGNFLSYAKRASIIMDEPAILKQVKRHKSIFRRYLKCKLERPPLQGRAWSVEENLTKW